MLHSDLIREDPGLTTLQLTASIPPQQLAMHPVPSKYRAIKMCPPISPTRRLPWQTALVLGFMGLIGGCTFSSPGDQPSQSGFEVKFLVGSALNEFCQQAIAAFNGQRPQLADGSAFYVTCEAKGSGDVVSGLINQAQQLKSGTLEAEGPDWPTLISVDGDIYQEQLAYQVNQLFPGQSYIPGVTDAPLLANSPMVFMVRSDLALSLRQTPDPFLAILTAKTHKDLDPASDPIQIRYVHTAPTRSNSGLQTLVAQFASVAGKPPEQLTAADINQFQDKVQQIQNKITRYGVSTHALSTAMVQNGPFWASVGSVYESSVIEANGLVPSDQPRFEAVYPQATFTSNMRGILANGPWISAPEKEAAQQVIDYLRSPAAQKIATDLGLRPGVPGIPLGAKFAPEWGVQPNPSYDSYRVPQPPVVEAMLQSWQTYAKKPSQVAIVIDSSGSMRGQKLAAVQSTLQFYLKSLGPKEKVALIDFDTQIRLPVLVDGTPEGQARGLAFISGLTADGDTKLFDATLYARNWLAQNLRPDAINAVVVLTDGRDSGSQIQLPELSQQLKQSSASDDQRLAFFTIGYGEAGSFAPDVLKQIADLNNGYYVQGDPNSIDTLMANLQLEF